MKTLWDFLIKYEFWFSFLIIIGLYIGEYRMSEMWMGELAFVMFLIAVTRLAYHPMWKKDKERGNE
jgi:hypothetical protein